MHRRKRRHSKTSWLNAVAICLMAAGVVVAFAGRQVLRWVPPPIPAASAAAGGGHRAARAHARPAHIVVRPTGRPTPAGRLPGHRIQQTRPELAPAGPGRAAGRRSARRG